MATTPKDKPASAIPQGKGSRVPGGLEGKIRIAPDFDDPLPDDLLDAFEGKDEA